MSNINIYPEDDFDLFATEVEDNLQEQIATGTYKWTNKYTAILGALVVITASVSGGIWYGNNHAASATTNALSNFASRVRGAAAGGAFTGAAGATGSGASAFAGAGAAGGASGFAAGGFGGGSRLSGTISKVNGNTVTITLDAAPSTPIAAGDAVSVRDTGAAGTATGATGTTGAASNGAPTGAAASGTAPTGTKRTRGTTAAGGTTSGTAPATGATSGQPSVGGGAAGGNGGGGGRFSNPAFTACLAKNGVTLTPGTRPDRTDPKVAAALQACFSTLGGGAPGAGGGFGGGARPAPSASATP